MAQTPELDELARQYLDLWQQHLGALAADGEVADTLAKTIELMNGSAATFARMTQQASTQPGGNNHGGEPSGAAPTGVAFGRSDDDLGKLAGRIEELERRIAELESAAGSSSKRAKKRPSGNKP